MSSSSALTAAGQDEAELERAAAAAADAGDLPRALDALLRLARRDTPRASHLRELGRVLHQLGQHAPAAAALELATRLAPGDALAWHLLGVAHYHEGRAAEAAAASLKAVRLDPGNADAFQNLGLSLGAQRDFEKAAEVLREAARLAPGSFSAWYNLGNQLLAANGFAAAEATFRRAVALQPDRPEPHINLALALLTQGKLAEAWPEFDWRWRGDHLRGGRRTDAPPLWHGAPAASTILLAVEQGIGDTLQFCRYAPLVAARGHRVVLEVQPEVLTLVSHSLAAPSVAVAARAADYPGIAGLPAADALCPMMSLPGIFATTLETIPAAPYLRTEPSKVAAWQERLAALGDGPRIGLVWAGNPQNDARRVDAWRSMPFATMAPLTRLEGIVFISLQKGAAAAQLAASAGADCHDAADALGDFADTAALVETLDLVISVDTAVAHLAGALGKPVWLLSRFNGCWRWLDGREDSPWYPTMRIFRQDRERSWPAVIAKVRAALVAWAAEARR